MRSNRIHVLRCTSRRVDDYVGQGRHLLISLAHSHSLGSRSRDIGDLSARPRGSFDVTCARERDHLLSAENFRSRRGERKKGNEREGKSGLSFSGWIAEARREIAPGSQLTPGFPPFFVPSRRSEEKNRQQPMTVSCRVSWACSKGGNPFSGSISRTNVSGKEGKRQ